MFGKGHRNSKGDLVHLDSPQEFEAVTLFILRQI
jgi:hypothetical protein